VAARLREIVGPEHVVDDADVIDSFARDWTGRFHGRASLVVRPKDTGEVAAVLRVLHDAGVPVVPQGGNTGLVGGGVPMEGEVVLTLRRLDQLGELEPLTAQVTAGAGVTLAQLSAHARAAGRDFAIDHGGRDAATVGGMIATNSGGIHAVRYGTTRAQVVGVEAVLADGSVVGSLAGLVKDTAGYDLASLLVGSEGTLAVITRARLRLVPRPAFHATALLALRDGEAALHAFATLRAQVPSLHAAEAVFGDGLELAAERLGVEVPVGGGGGERGVHVLVEAASHIDPLDELAAALDEIDADGVAFAQDARQRERLWALREGISEAIAAHGIPHKLDVAVPVPVLPAFAGAVRALVARERPGARTVLFGHLGDGNLHVNVLGLDPADDDLDGAVLWCATDHGGTISAEHGIGRAKRRWLSLVRSEAEIAAMRQIKRALDPAAILNPGAVLPE
jgi:FAD/FMN-containing dehydrogenase